MIVILYFYLIQFLFKNRIIDNDYYRVLIENLTKC